MRAIILSNDHHGYRKIMAESLCRLFHKAGVSADILLQGYNYLNPCARKGNTPREFVKQWRENAYFLKFLCGLRKYDLLVLVSHVPEAFLRDRFIRLEIIRKYLPALPIINYDLVYMPTCNSHAEMLLQGHNKFYEKGGNYGLDRYDWYLNISVVSEHPMPPGFQPYTQIGCHMDDGTLFPEQKSFTALLDFDVPDHRGERAIQIEALSELGIPYTTLKGRYPVEDIRSIYRKTSLFFLSKRESYGLSISEVQACGSYIVSPYREWFPAHWIKADIHQTEPDGYSPNFIVYDNDKQRLVKELIRIRAGYSSSLVVQQFLKHHRAFFYGDPEKMNEFIEAIRTKRINSKSHHSYPVIEQVVKTWRANAMGLRPSGFSSPLTGKG